MVHRAFVEGVAINDWTPEVRQWFAVRSPKLYIRPVRGGIHVASVGAPRPVPGIHAPTLLLQGANDTLFPINEGIANMLAIAANGADTKLIVFCGSLDGGAEPAHSVNLAGTSCESGGEAQGDRIGAAILAWFDRYVRDPLGDAPTGARIEFQTQDGAFHSTPELPSTVVRARGTGTLAHLVAPTSGVVTAPQPSPDGVRIPIKARAGWTLFGVPRAEVEVTGAGSEVNLFFKLLDIAPDGRATVIDDQVMPRKVTNLSDEPQRFTVGLGGVAWQVKPGHSLALEISTGSNDHAFARAPALADVSVSFEAPILRSLVESSGVRGAGR
jgi:ABC-2 type transport system ATP-binding protein